MITNEWRKKWKTIYLDFVVGWLFLQSFRNYQNHSTFRISLLVVGQSNQSLDQETAKDAHAHNNRNYELVAHFQKSDTSFSSKGAVRALKSKEMFQTFWLPVHENYSRLFIDYATDLSMQFLPLRMKHPNSYGSENFVRHRGKLNVQEDENTTRGRPDRFSRLTNVG